RSPRSALRFSIRLLDRRAIVIRAQHVRTVRSMTTERKRLHGFEKGAAIHQTNHSSAFWLWFGKNRTAVKRVTIVPLVPAGFLSEHLPPPPPSSFHRHRSHRLADMSTFSSASVFFGVRVDGAALDQALSTFALWRPAAEELRLAHSSRYPNPFAALPIELVWKIESALWDAIATDDAADAGAPKDDPHAPFLRLLEKTKARAEAPKILGKWFGISARFFPSGPLGDNGDLCFLVLRRHARPVSEISACCDDDDMELFDGVVFGHQAFRLPASYFAVRQADRDGLLTALRVLRLDAHGGVPLARELPAKDMAIGGGKGAGRPSWIVHHSVDCEVIW
ncbi:hypothetical protein DFJ74DRAFT_734779, partial [Hyaloraphidium curvatum]